MRLELFVLQDEVLVKGESEEGLWPKGHRFESPRHGKVGGEEDNDEQSPSNCCKDALRQGTYLTELHTGKQQRLY